MTGSADVWALGAAYEPYIGRWSRLVARQFLAWLSLPRDVRWLDVGCGTGMLTRAIAQLASPREVVGVDPSEGFLNYARGQEPGARYVLGDARALPFEDGVFDVVVSGLVLNFVPEPVVAVREMGRVGRTLAGYVWDYASEMHMLRTFWNAVAALDPTAAELDEGRRFPLCQPNALRELWEAAGLQQVAIRAIEVPTVFTDFDDYWSPFLGGQGPAPTYVAALTEHARDALRERLRATLPTGRDGSIALLARAWAVRGAH
jgi:SAM-dependent methyltransferase